MIISIDTTRGDNPDKVRQFVGQYGIHGPAVYEPLQGDGYQTSGYPMGYELVGNGWDAANNPAEAPGAVYEEWIQKAPGTWRTGGLKEGLCL